MDSLSSVLLILQIVGAIIAIVGSIWGVLYSFGRFIFKPLKRIYNEFESFNLILNNLSDDVIRLKHAHEHAILPMIESFHREFSTNGGKSIKDQITRIDDNTRLSELRSKLIATTLITSGSFECDAHGNWTWANKALADLFGLSLEEMLGNGWLAAVQEHDRMDIWDNWKNAILNNIPYEGVFTIINRKTRKSFQCRANAFQHKAVDGRILGYYGTIVKEI